MNSTWKFLQSKLKQNKKELIRELSRELIDDELLIKAQCGCRGHIKNMPGTFYINCRKNGEPWATTGRGKYDKSHYFWIPIIYENNNVINNYIVSLFKEDLDDETGNIHHNFTEIQIVKNLYESPEIGGAYNPSPKKKGDSYIVEHQFLYSFPCIVSKERNKKPWGYDIEEIPVLDMKDENYSPTKIAKFVWELIRRDLDRH